MIYGFCANEVDLAIFQSLGLNDRAVYSNTPLQDLPDLTGPDISMRRQVENMLQLRPGAIPKTEDMEPVLTNLPNNLAHFRVRNVCMSYLAGGFFFLATEENLHNPELHKLVLANKCMGKTVVAVIPMDFRSSDASLLADCSYCVAEGSIENLSRVLTL